MPARPPIEAERVLLLSMPFGALERPSIALGLLHAHCQRLDVPCDTRYVGFRFAERIGLGNYLWLCSDQVPYTAFAGEWGCSPRPFTAAGRRAIRLTSRRFSVTCAG